MKKIIISIVFLSSIFVSTLSVSGKNLSNFSDTKIFCTNLGELPREVWREYVLVDDQWYLVIHYDDGSTNWIPVAKPGED